MGSCSRHRHPQRCPGGKLTARPVWAVLSVLVLASAPAAALYAEAVEAHGSVAAASPEGTQAQFLVVRPAPVSGLVLALDAEQLTERIVGMETTRVHTPHTMAITQPYEPEGRHAGGPARATLAEIHDSAVIMVMPLSPLTVVRTDVQGPVRITTVAEEVIERTQTVPGDGQRTPGTVPEDFEFVARNTARLSADGSGFQSVTGDFLLYLWGVSYELSGSGSSAVTRTGHQQMANHAGVVTQERYVYSFLTVHGGSLSIQYRSAPSALYADAGLAATDGEVALEGAAGTVAVADERIYRVAGNVTLAGASLNWRALPEGLRVAVVSTSGVRGDAAVVGAGWVALPLLGVAFGTALVAAAAGAAWSRPLAAARSAGPDADGRGAAGAGRRALGWSELANQASGRSRYRLASWYAQRAIRNDPVDGRHYTTRALASANLRQYARALEHHKMAHWIYQAQKADSATVARNAFEASCVASNLHRSREAVHWLRIALHHDPALQHEAAYEPDLGPISQDPAFQCLVAGVVDVRW